MPYDDPDPTDPMTLTGVEIATDDPGAIRAMAECFIEEYVRLGLSAEAIAELFESRRYAGPTLALDGLGSKVILELIQEQMLLRGPRAARVQIAKTAGGSIQLPVLEH
ncbi:MAG: hypothetical protein L6Q92_07535 [Phycisphaerae bacterium]|nr:hypothetical protein [Phycisphaerae bacterium]